MLFEVDPGLAASAAWALVLLNLALEFLIHYIEHNDNYKPHIATRFSLRLWWQNTTYILGIGRNWQVKTSSPAERYKALLRLVTFSILALALAGSMRSVITEVDGAWYLAIGNIFTQSNLSRMMTWLGGLLFAAAAVLAAQGLSRYVALRTVEVRTQMDAQQSSPERRYAAALEAVAINYVLAKVAASQTRQDAKDALEVAPSHVPFSMNGTKSHSEME